MAIFLLVITDSGIFSDNASSFFAFVVSSVLFCVSQQGYQSSQS